ncbi:MAG: prolyl oligopeptidase family serine peptidase [Cyclonatronaceae bacterium]
MKTILILFVYMTSLTGCLHADNSRGDNNSQNLNPSSGESGGTSAAESGTAATTESGTAATAESATLLPYPETRQSDVVDEYFGTRIADPYRWLEDDQSGETADWVKAQNEVTFHYLDQIPFREHIRQRLTDDWNYERLSAPNRHGDYYYFSRNDGLQNHSVIYRSAEPGGDAEVFLDPNAFSEDGSTSLAGLSFTQDGSLAAYMISEGGSDWRKAIVLDTRTMEQIGDTLVDIKFSGISWHGNEGFYYSSYDPPEGSQLSARTELHKLYFHRIGTPQYEDKMVFGGEETPRRYISGGITEDQRYLIIFASENSSGNELYIRDLENENGELLTVVDHFDNEHQIIHTDGDRILIHTNLDAPNYRLVEASIHNPAPENWVDIIPETDHVLSASSAGGYLFANYLIDVQTQIRQFDLKGNFIRNVTLPAIGTAFGFSGKRTDTTLHYTFTSFTYPSTIYKYDIREGQSELYWTPDINFDPEAYTTEQVFFESRDGTRIPMFITYKKGLEMDGTNPAYLFAYGGFNVSLRPSFSTARLVWLENGGIYAQPNIRGGGEYGEQWHNAGRRENRQNVFDDFIASAEYLVDMGYTSHDRLAIAGGSNGGLLVGAVMTQRPDLAAVAFPAVGVLDMLRYHSFTAGAGWAFDYGTADESEDMFRYLLRYSPVHNVRAGEVYPSTMVTTADHDDRVVPAHSYKFVAELQNKHAGDNPVLIRIETRAGHGDGRTTESVISEWADRYAFAWFTMGIDPFSE